MERQTNAIAASFATPRDGALEMARRGHDVFPLKPNSKVPFVAKHGDDPVLSGGINIASLDPAKIEFWFKRNPAINYGVTTTGYAVIDVDPHNDEDGWIGDYIELGPIPHTFRVITWSGGEHLYFTGIDAGQRKISRCIDVRGHGGYVVGPGSIIDGRHYRVHVDAPPAWVPAAIAAKISKPGEKSADNSTPVAELDTVGAITYGKDLVKRAPGAVQGERNNKLHRLACVLKDKGMSAETSLELLTEHWCPRCDPPYVDFGEIEGTVTSAYANGQKQPGVDAAEGEFDDLSSDPDIVAWQEKWTARSKPAASSSTAPKSITLWVDDQPLDAGIEWLVDEVLPQRGIGFLAAPSTYGKTFLLFHFMLCVARGTPFFGRVIDSQGGSYLVAGEAAYSVPHRVGAAVRYKFGEGGAPIAYEASAPNLRGKEERQAFIDRVRAADADMRQRYGMPLRIVAFDTYQKCLAGKDENDSKSAGDGVRVMQEICDLLGVAVLCTHHFGKDPTQGIRGSSAFKADVDLVLTVPKKGQLKLDKVREGPDGPLGEYTLHKVTLGTNAKGRPITSMYVQEGAGTDPSEEFERIEDDSAESVLARVVSTAITNSGQEIKNPYMDEVIRAVPLKMVRTAFYEAWEGNVAAKKKAFQRARETIAELKIDGEDYVYLDEED